MTLPPDDTAGGADSIIVDPSQVPLSTAQLVLTPLPLMLLLSSLHVDLGAGAGLFTGNWWCTGSST